MSRGPHHGQPAESGEVRKGGGPRVPSTGDWGAGPRAPEGPSCLSAAASLPPSRALVSATDGAGPRPRSVTSPAPGTRLSVLGALLPPGGWGEPRPPALPSPGGPSPPGVSVPKPVAPSEPSPSGCRSRAPGRRHPGHLSARHTPGVVLPAPPSRGGLDFQTIFSALWASVPLVIKGVLAPTHGSKVLPDQHSGRGPGALSKRRTRHLGGTPTTGRCAAPRGPLLRRASSRDGDARLPGASAAGASGAT